MDNIRNHERIIKESLGNCFVNKTPILLRGQVKHIKFTRQQFDWRNGLYCKLLEQQISGQFTTVCLFFPVFWWPWLLHNYFSYFSMLASIWSDSHDLCAQHFLFFITKLSLLKSYCIHVCEYIFLFLLLTLWDPVNFLHFWNNINILKIIYKNRK